MKKIKITQEKQENGIWGMPYNCYKIDNSPLLFDDRKLFLRSAIITALSQFYKSFEIFLSSDDYFFVRADEKTYKIIYDKYEVLDDILYEFETNEERVFFLRKIKMDIINSNSILV